MVKYAEWFSFIILLSLVLTGSKTFMLWSQVTYLWGANVAPLTMTIAEEAHFLRYMLTYPIFYISDIMQLDHDFLFSLILSFLFVLNAMVLSRTMKRQNVAYQNGFIAVSVTLLLLALYLISNGRGPLALFGYSLIISELIKIEFIRGAKASSFIYFAIGIFFCSVSTGVMLSACVVLITFLTLNFFTFLIGRLTLVKYVKQFMLISLALLVFKEPIVMAVKKNMNYYGGGIDSIFKMLNHGWGEAVYDHLYGVSGHVFIAVIGVMFLFGLLLSALCFSRSIQTIAAVSLICGAYGYTTFAVAIIPLMFLINYWVSRSSQSMKRIINA